MALTLIDDYMEDKLSPQYNAAVQQIKMAILRSQAKALAGINQEQLALYFGIGRFISQNSRAGFWGKDAIDTISRQLSAEMPGLRGFSPRNLRNMRTFYEQWRVLDNNLADTSAKLDVAGNMAEASAKTTEEKNLIPLGLLDFVIKVQKEKEEARKHLLEKKEHTFSIQM